MITEGWWTGFFTGLIAESWRRVPLPTEAEADFIVQETGLKPGERVLDVPCGGGRLSAALASRGAITTGVDMSDDYLADAARHPGGTWLRRDMRDLSGLGPFDHAFCFGNSFSYFDDAGNRGFLSAVAKVLRPGGRFVLQTNLVAESIFGQPLGKRWYEFGDMIFMHDSNYDPATATLTSDYILLRGGEMERKQAKYRVYTYAQILAMLGDAGFRIVTSYGTLDRQPFRLGSAGLWVVAQRH